MLTASLRVARASKFSVMYGWANTLSTLAQPTIYCSLLRTLPSLCIASPLLPHLCYTSSCPLWLNLRCRDWLFARCTLQLSLNNRAPLVQKLQQLSVPLALLRCCKGHSVQIECLHRDRHTVRQRNQTYKRARVLCDALRTSGAEE